MTLEDFIQQSWAQHDSHSAEVADRLEANTGLVTDAQGAAGFMHLAAHTIGDHLGDRTRALLVCETIVGRLGAEPGASALIQLAVARTLAGDEAGAAEARGRLTDASSSDASSSDDPLTDDAANNVRIGMLVAQGRMHGGEWDAASALYGDHLAQANALPVGHTAERAVAMTSNSIASELLELDRRSPEQDKLMEATAKAARTYWVRVGNWMNDERGDYLLAKVHTALERPTEARMYAQRGLQTIVDSEGEERVDEAFLHLARAAACRDLGALDDQAASIAHAEVLAREFEGDWLKSWFEGELAKAH